jgi:hypothetical protein
MKNKILIGSILAVVLMVLASCGSVVGAETNKKGLKVKEIQEEINEKNIKEMLESIIEKMDMGTTMNPEDPQQQSIILGIIVLLIIYCIPITIAAIVYTIIMKMAGWPF